jgi:hypothetical protein
MPSTWIGRGLRIEYTDSGGDALATDATLLDVYPFGPVLNIAGARTLLSWNNIALLELVEG